MFSIGVDNSGAVEPQPFSKIIPANKSVTKPILFVCFFMGAAKEKKALAQQKKSSRNKKTTLSHGQNSKKKEEHQCFFEVFAPLAGTENGPRSAQDASKTVLKRLFWGVQFCLRFGCVLGAFFIIKFLGLKDQILYQTIHKQCMNLLEQMSLLYPH